MISALRPLSAPVVQPWFRRFAVPSFVVALSGLMLCPRPAPAQDAYAFSVLAGNSGFGYANGSGADARFTWPEGIVIDGSGNLYVADNRNFCVRRISASGTVTTIAGLPGVSGFADGQGVVARFNTITGMALDPSGNLLVADTGNCVIRRVTPAGMVTTVAGVPRVSGATDGPVATATFDSPAGLATDASGNIYVCDSDNNVIRKISGGAVTTLAGKAGPGGYADGTGTDALFSGPFGIVVDASGNVYVADTGNHVIRKITPGGAVSTFAGSAGQADWVDGKGAAARFYSPRGLTISAGGTLYVADTRNEVLRMIRSDGTVATIAGGVDTRGYVDGPVTAARFFWPYALAIDANANIYVADTYNSCIRKASPTDGVSTVAGKPSINRTDGPRGSGGFFLPLGLAADRDGNVYVADYYNHAIRKVTPDGNVSTIAGKLGTRGYVDGAAADARFYYPHAVAIDAAGNVYVSDNNNFVVRKISASGIVGTIAGVAGSPGSADGPLGTSRFSSLEAIAVDASGNVFVADRVNYTIRKISPDGLVTTIAGMAGKPGSADGTGAAARFSDPVGLAIDRAGNLYVAEGLSCVVRKITPTGVVTTLAGMSGYPEVRDGVGGQARFYSPTALAVDADGNVFVADSAASSIRRITPSGAVTTIGGAFSHVGQSDGVSGAARFVYPSGIAVDPIGNLYISDYDSCAIRKGGLVAPANPPSSLVNASVRANIAAGQRLIVGFGTTGGAKPVLLRAIGPGLSPYASGLTLANDPSLELYNSAVALVDSNDNWGGGATLTNASAAVGAFPLSPGSRDAVLLRSVNGTYSAHAFSPQGGLALVELYDTAPSNSVRLTNLSARYQVGTGTDALVAGFVISGSGSKTILIRGVGPTLKYSFGVDDALTDPVLTVYNSKQEVVATSDNWQVDLASAFDRVGAFPLIANSGDAALMVSLPPGGYTAQLSGNKDGTGNGLIELYEVGN